MNKPERPYEIEIHIGAGNIQGIISSLVEIERCISENESRGSLCNPHDSVSGSPSSGWNFQLRRTETKDNEEYFQQIEKYISVTSHNNDCAATAQEPSPLEPTNLSTE